MAPSLAVAAHFTALDWGVLVAYFIATSLIGARFAGKQATIREFFLGGRKLPWPAVAGSIIATEVSAVTFISVPALVFAPGGDLTYLQFAIGAIIARVVIGVWFTPAFYEREIYSPYEYVGQRLGPPARSVTSGLFTLSAILGQSVRVYLTAMILREITGLDLGWSIAIIGAIAVAWTLAGGIATVIWTDVIQFGVFTLGLVIALIYAWSKIPGGAAEILDAASSAVDATGAPASKLRFLSLSLNPQQAYTIYTALTANVLLCLFAYGTDQLIAQRMFCCRGPREARKAIIWSSVGHLLAVLAAGVGLALYAFYQHHPLDPADAARVAASRDAIFPMFIVQQIPAGLTGLLIAGVFAAAISSLDSALAALAQTSVSNWYIPLRKRLGHTGVDDDRHAVRASYVFVVIWAVVMCGMAAVVMEPLERKFEGVLNLALAMASLPAGALLAAFLIALFRIRVDWRGVAWGAPVSMLSVFALNFHFPGAPMIVLIVAIAIFAWWISARVIAWDFARRGAQTGLLLAALSIPLILTYYHPTPGEHIRLAWPWNVPIGFGVAFALGVGLARRAPDSAETAI
ncbi:MAG: sodium/solute symporter [Phycisphaerales bacterium]|nr:sodium/solute symporter [Phycisphaerales bacterium]